ncbi:MarR family winged helix-turn-helix transcriptional regulator [Nocardia sp. CC227C]|uniref:MarR family winged helix-turn-helix transcriptional regulator n=1 Tax=Nocardia sp. CC227C TaxID=3044562 RepID=UPI00278C125D|nr:MarR family transcriptional regulator [Nocardia sp. CC227C]
MRDRSDVDGRIERAIRQLIARAVFVNDVVARRLGLRMIDMEVLNLVAMPGGPASHGEVAGATGLPSTSVTRVLDRLEAAGFIRREPDAKDRRRIVLVPDRGRLAAFERLYAPLRDANRARNARYPVAELESVARYLEEHVADRSGVGAMTSHAKDA